MYVLYLVCNVPRTLLASANFDSSQKIFRSPLFVPQSPSAERNIAKQMVPRSTQLWPALICFLYTCVSVPQQTMAFSSFTGSKTIGPRPRCGGAQRATRTVVPTMALDIKIRIVGRKNAEKWLDDGYAVYETRLKPANVQVTTIYHKNDAELLKGVAADSGKSHAVALLDPQGQTLDSEEFADRLYDWLEEGGSRITFVIGGAEGLPAELRAEGYQGGRGSGRKKHFISLSAMTFTHQWARTILIEQIYRASEIRKGSGYHK